MQFGFFSDCNDPSQHFKNKSPHSNDFLSGARRQIFLLLRIIFYANHLTQYFKWGPKRGARSQIFLLFRIIFNANSPHSNDFSSGTLSVGPVAKFSYFASFLSQIISLTRFFKWGPERGTRSQIFLLRIIFNAKHLTYTFFKWDP